MFKKIFISLLCGLSTIVLANPVWKLAIDDQNPMSNSMYIAGSHTLKFSQDCIMYDPTISDITPKDADFQNFNPVSMIFVHGKIYIWNRLSSSSNSLVSDGDSPKVIGMPLDITAEDDITTDHESNIYVQGYNSKTYHNDIMAFNINNESWSVLADSGTKDVTSYETNSLMSDKNGGLYVVGNGLFGYDVKTGKWSNVYPNAGYPHTFNNNGDFLFVTYDTVTYKNSLMKYSLVSGITSCLNNDTSASEYIKNDNSSNIYMFSSHSSVIVNPEIKIPTSPT